MRQSGRPPGIHQGRCPMRLRRFSQGFLLLLFVFGAVAMARAQAAAEYAGATAAAATAAAGAKVKIKPPSVPSPKEGSNPSSPQPAIRVGEAAAAANRQALQERAGANAARVLLRSTPDHAQVWIDTRFVGSTPFELKLAPGHHDIMMKAPDMASLHQEIELQGKQTREVMMMFKAPPPPSDSKPRDN
jgi:hypothetical protein